MLRAITLVMLFFTTTSCSSLGFLFFSNNVDRDIDVSYREEFITLAPSSHSERFRRSSNPIPMSVAVGDCKYDYDEKRFFDAVSARDLEKFDRRVRFVMEIAIHPNGEIRLYQFNPDTRARVFEILPAGYRITPINKDGEADC